MFVISAPSLPRQKTMIPPMFDLAVLALCFAQAAMSTPSDHRYKELDPVPLYTNKVGPCSTTRACTDFGLLLHEVWTLFRLTPSSRPLLQPLPMNGSIVSWLLLAISMISISFEVAGGSASAQCLGVDQRSLLLKLRNSLVFNASKSSMLVQWDRSGDSWSGVTCEDGLVIGLDLSNESISGGIDGSSSLFRLEFLRSLNLAFNYFNYLTIPSGIANLSRLVHLNLSNAGFVGKIPAELSRLRKLRSLDLTCLSSYPAFLKLEKPSLRALIGDLVELRELYLDLVDVSAEGSGWCDALSSSVPKLEVLSMSNCSLSGPLKASLMSLANLSVIQLYGNNFYTTVPKFLANFSSLKTLSLAFCGTLPVSIGNLKKLSSIELQLGMLDLGSNQLQGPIPASIFKLQGLGYLSLSSDNFSGSMNIDALRGFGNLAYHDLSYNGKSINTMASASAAASSFPDFHTLKLASCQLRSLPQFLANQSTLVSLDLSHNYIQGEIPRWIYLETPLPNIPSDLAVVDLHLNMLQGNMLPLPSHGVYLDFSSNYIDSVIPDDIGDYLLGTMFFSLSKTNFHGSIPKSIYKAEFLQVLDLSRNQLNGTIPDCFVMKSLKVLNLRDNQLNGDIPQNIPGTCGLKTLDFSENFL
ncbi:receptor-like protein 6 [Syzygium oleosum]|uniref:receptor-like protein 6 n=1 Tax=Syzygium oleosum TaxID=219896 RepID=UPI0024B8CB0F|nr:receptor-like protein 6 [Syzygium oleosum]